MNTRILSSLLAVTWSFYKQFHRKYIGLQTHSDRFLGMADTAAVLKRVLHIHKLDVERTTLLPSMPYLFRIRSHILSIKHA